MLKNLLGLFLRHWNTEPSAREVVLWFVILIAGPFISRWFGAGIWVYVICRCVRIMHLQARLDRG